MVGDVSVWLQHAARLIEYIYNLFWLSCPLLLLIAICLAMLASSNFIHLPAGIKIQLKMFSACTFFLFKKALNTSFKVVDYGLGT